MNDHNKYLSSLLGIGILVSSYKDSIVMSKSMINLLPYLKDTEVCICVNGKDFEGTLGQDRLNEILLYIPKELKVHVVGPISYDEVRKDYYSDAGEDSSLQFLKLRQLSVSKIIDKKYWFIADDDMEFLGPTKNNPSNIGLQLLRIVEYMEKNPKCGVVKGGSTLIQKLSNTEIALSHRPGYMLQGMMIRNIDNQVVPDDMMLGAGGGEDGLFWAYRIYKGYYPAVMKGLRINHHTTFIKNDDTDSINKGWHRRSVRRHPIYGFETLMSRIGWDHNFNDDSLDKLYKKTWEFVDKSLGETLPEYSYKMDMSYII